ncbi:MAG: alanine racemase [Salinivirgaceae bacterium]|nr:alanine racemase [Salinivirgaceae bacterium]MDD4745986.1 alanine racemase [Salinivirgaceae bacterium]MDY0280657.1 alanine racemase [Salinivirgaceae bacterium]
MAQLRINTNKIIGNITKINRILQKHDIQWSLVAKILAGNKEVLRKILSHPEIKKLHSIADSRLTGLRAIKSIDPEITTMYAKPPAMDSIKSVVTYADISLNSSFKTIEALDKEAGRQGKTHRVIIMIELGELREGIIREHVLTFYKKVFDLKNVVIEGIGANLGCMYGIQPTYDKLLQLSLYKQLIEAKFDTSFSLISGGSSITLPLVGKPSMPKNLNHLRIGEAAFLGTTPIDNEKFRTLATDAFEYRANIIELELKETSPDGVLTEGNIGHTVENNEQQDYQHSYRAILDFGLLDVDIQELKAKDPEIKFAGTTSDMSVYDLGPALKNKSCKYKVGDKVIFVPSYMAIARLMSSKFIDKSVDHT